MRIVVNDIAASTGGALEILRQFYNYIREHDDSNEWIFLLGAPLLEETERVKIILLPEVKNSKLKKLKFDLFSGKKTIDKLKPDVVLSLQNIITFGVKAPQYVYIHQSIPYQKVRNFSFLKREERGIAVYQHLIGKLIDLSAKHSDGVIVQSKWMKTAVAEKVKIPLDKIITAMPECGFTAGQTDEAFDNRRFFYPTANSIYKNNDIILQACDILNRRGIDNFKVYMTLDKNVITHHNIECTGYLDKQKLASEYARATLLFPSYIETVGLPLLEAANFGVPIIASNCPHSIDILEGYENAMYFEPFSAEQLADLMENRINAHSNLVRCEAPNFKSGWDDVHAYICR